MAERFPQAIKLPPGRHPLPREFITQHQRARIIAALAEETVEKGYRSVTVADIVRRAGIARNTFYENFSSKEDCFLHYVATEPALARTCIVEALSAGPAAVERYERSIQAFVPLFRMGRKSSPNGEDLPGTLEETIVGGIFWILYQRIVMGQVEEIEELLPELVEFSLTPYVGAEAAKRNAAEAPSGTDG